ncbi:MAG: HlyD family efflux transporter periplasmic adaptor subunit [Saccharofermentans sp.]|nr:HlyD family efflux transporter periplasmic adaptor subunit [Saccharofermentans sp.]
MTKDRGMNPEANEELFAAKSKNKKKRKIRITITIISIIVVLLIAAGIIISILQKKVKQQFASSSDDVKSYVVEAGTISTVVSGSGTLSDVDLTVVSVPNGVEVTEVYIKANEKINEGDVIASVNMSSVMSTMADLQVEIGKLDKQISDAKDDEASATVSAGVAGRVKVIYAKKSDSVSDVMAENGCLAIISLDGYMAVDIETDALVVGDKVTVVLSDGKEKAGTVEKVSLGNVTVILTDNGPEFDDAVTVVDSDKKEIGKGKLYIHNPLKITGYAGLIEKVHVSLNGKVSSSDKIFTLKDTAISANYYSLLRTRNEKEEVLMELLKIERNGAVLSPISGSVYSVDYETESSNKSANSDSIAIAQISNDEKMSLNISVDESDILSLSVGQEVEVTVSSVSENAFTGTVTEINKTSSDSGTFSAVIELDKADGMLSGMTATASVKIEGVEDAVIIPVAALHKTSDGAYVYTVYDEENAEYGGRTDVVTGLENSTYIEIKSGLNVGQTVYYKESTSSSWGTNNRPNGGNGNMPGFNGDGPQRGNRDRNNMGAGFPGSN